MDGWGSSGLEVLGAEDFEQTRLKRAGLYTVCFGATWCFPTRLFVPKFTARQYRVGGRRAIADITDLQSPLWETFGVRITPTLVVFRDGAPVGRFDGRRVLGLRNADLDRMTELVAGLTGETPSGTASPVAS
jgi:thioredoxin-like negative regulator of GroEL